MRLIDADKFMKIVLKCEKANKECPLLEEFEYDKDVNNYENGQKETFELIIEQLEKQLTAYDVDKVVEQINSIGEAYCDSVKCDKNCEDCDHGCIMRAITEKVKAGGID